MRKCSGSAEVSAELVFDRVPLLDRAALIDYVERGALPGGTARNAASLGDDIGPLTDLQRAILCDPQTSGGLLVSCAPDSVNEVLATLRRDGFDAAAVIGELRAGEPLAIVE